MIADSLFPEASSPRPVLVSFGAPTGGLGTTLLASNLAITLAKKGSSVLLADLALTEASCHLALGIVRPERHLGSVVSKEVVEVREAIIPTSVNNLSLLAGHPEAPEVANLAYLTKQKILASLSTLPYDFVLLDAGSGTGADTLDFLLAGRHCISIVQATAVGVEPFYRFLRAMLHRLLMESLNRKRYQALASSLDSLSPLRGLWEMQETRAEDLASVERGIEGRDFGFVQTGFSNDKELRMGVQLEALIRRYFLCPVRFLGGVEWDPQAAAAHRGLEPIAKAYPLCPFSLSVEKLANLLLKEVREPSPSEGHLAPVPAGGLNAYQLLELPYNAAPKDLQSAYARLLEPYLETSPLTLSLYTKEEREAIRDRLEEAYKMLINSGLRQRYDEELIAKGQMRPEQRIPEYREEKAEGGYAASSAPGPNPQQEDTAARTHRNLETVLQEISHFNGEALRRVREAQGISVAEIVSETNIRSWYIECIEAEKFESLPGLIYLKGFVRQVARYLHLDPERVLADYLDCYHAWKQKAK
jgi:flagellar biosynthesis protein FlhG